jgi:hypothetical protein
LCSGNFCTKSRSLGEGVMRSELRPGTGAGRWALGHVAFRLGGKHGPGVRRPHRALRRRGDSHDAELKRADSVSTFRHARNRGNCGHGSEAAGGFEQDSFWHTAEVFGAAANFVRLQRHFYRGGVAGNMGAHDPKLNLAMPALSDAAIASALRVRNDILVR